MISSLPLVHLQSIPAKSVIIHKKNNILYEQNKDLCEQSSILESIRTKNKYGAMDYWVYSLGVPIVVAYVRKYGVYTEVTCPECGKKANFLTRSLFGHWQCPYCKYTDVMRFEFIE